MHAFLLAAFAALLLGGCTYEYPLADAEAAIADDELVGIWHLPEAGDLENADVMFLPMHSGRYLLTFAASKPEAPGSDPGSKLCEQAMVGWGLAQGHMVAHVTELGGARFLNLEFVCGDEGYALARYWIRGDTARFVTVDNLKGPFGSSEEVAAAVRSRLDDPELYGDTILAYRVPKRTNPVTVPGTRP